METLGKTILALGINYGVHYGSIWAHNQLCMPHSFQELLMGVVVTASPVCSMTLTVAQYTQNSYASIFTTTVSSGIVETLKSFV